MPTNSHQVYRRSATPLLAGVLALPALVMTLPLAGGPAGAAAGAAESVAPATAAVAPESPAASRLRVVLLVEEGPAADAIEAGATRGATEQQIDLLTLTVRPTNAAQERALRDVVTDRPTAIAVAVSRPGELSETISEARTAGIPVVLVRRGLDDWQALGAQGFVGQDDVHAGEVAARALLDAGVQHAFCVQDVVHDPILEARCEGAIAAMSAAGGNMTPLYALDPPGDPSGVPSAIAGRIARDPSIDGALVTEEDGLAGILSAQDRVPADQDITTVAIAEGPAGEGVQAALAAGDLDAVVDPLPEVQGEQAMTFLRQLIDGDMPESPLIIEPRILDGDDA